VKAGDVAGYARPDGYRRIGVDGGLYFSHRLAWLYVHGRWPEKQIDHKNTIPGDDRFENLRDTTHAGNQQNKRQAQSNNKIGLLGVSPNGKKFQARIMFDSKHRPLGTFATAEAAHAAYVVAKRQLHATCTI